MDVSRSVYRDRVDQTYHRSPVLVHTEGGYDDITRQGSGYYSCRDRVDHQRTSLISGLVR